MRLKSTCKPRKGLGLFASHCQTVFHLVLVQHFCLKKCWIIFEENVSCDGFQSSCVYSLRMANRHRLSQRHQLTKVSILTFKNGGCILVYSPGLSISTIILDPITFSIAQMLILSAKHNFRDIETAAKTTLTSTYFMTRLQAFFLNRSVLNSRATFDLTSWFA